ncbi:alcohol acetyltransferase [Brachybacterium sp. P6-10-X1]|uniref:alcohol acetyltransferase n=1 Tax=Brachybacterium sp. P6-10-X1 TaxID=1903186 RepID=UPI000971BEB3|nr:alcohol acetyltransferase [Brachybacterium sp. P6-10-X1]APX34149.1 alcohol acetyltransferase [Brachybacterium sp. P6-10-X1]
MSREAWVRLDNASNIFLAARSEVDPKVFRLSAELDHEVDPQLLQEALESTYERYRLYHAVLRRGVFWYYLQDSDLQPQVIAEETAPCAPIYQADRRTLLFRVMHHHRRISLEVFHALADGTGALWFLTDLVAAYVRRRFPDPALPGSDEPDRDGAAAPAAAAPAPTEPVHHLTTDDFVHYFRRRRRRRRPDAWAERAAFSREAAPAPLTVAVDVEDDESEAREERPAPPDSPVHHLRGTRTPDSRPRLVELTMPAAPVLGLARAEGAALTMYLTAVLFDAVRRSSGGLGKARTLAASVPVNLRQFFPSTSARNFFATTRIQHTYGEGDDSLGRICRALECDFRAKASADHLEHNLRRFLRFERMPLLRVVPRPLKDVILSQVNRANNRGLTVAVSNLGRVTMPEPSAAHVQRLLFHVSAVRPQISVISHGDVLTISFTSPFVETDHVREFVRILTDAGVDVSVAAARTTEAELAAAGEGGP